MNPTIIIDRGETDFPITIDLSQVKGVSDVCCDTFGETWGFNIYFGFNHENIMMCKFFSTNGETRKISDSFFEIKMVNGLYEQLKIGSSGYYYPIKGSVWYARIKSIRDTLESRWIEVRNYITLQKQP